MAMNRVLLLAGVLTVFVPTVGRAAAEQQIGQSTNQAGMQTCTLKVSGMTCASCDVAVKIAAKTVSGVKTVKVDYPKGKAEVTYDASRTNPQTIADAITELSGFKTEPMKPAKK
jgi:copper chaperone CopZ